MVEVLPDIPRKGRGSASNRSGRFEPETRVRIDDGWAADGEDAPPPRTTVTDETPRHIITRNTSPDVPFDRSINPYRGCEHGCAYCFARLTHAYMGLSAGLDFETRLFAKPDAPRLLERELRRPGYRCAVIAIGTNTDPYQPVERQRGIMRAILEVLAAYNHPVGIVTKSDLVLRDLDILAPMAARGLVSVALSVTTLDRDLARRLEPRAATPPRRLAAIRGLAEAGVPAGVMAAPMIPGLNDAEMEAILAEARAAGATRAGWILLRLPGEVQDLFAEWLAEHRPNQARKVLSLIRQCRDGALYRSEFGSRMRGGGAYAGIMEARFRKACVRLGLNVGRAADTGLDTTRFAPPPRTGDQMSLL